jgi:hypothetical protein
MLSKDFLVPGGATRPAGCRGVVFRGGPNYNLRNGLRPCFPMQAGLKARANGQTGAPSSSGVSMLHAFRCDPESTSGSPG